MQTIKELFTYRNMIVSLVRKDLRGRYKGSILGLLWTFINPLFQILIYTIVFSTIMKSNIPQYSLFLVVALIPWIFFSSCVVGGSGCVLSESSLVTKIYFPREVIPVAYTTSQFVNMLFSFVIVFLMVIFSGRTIFWHTILYLIFIMITEYFFALGLVLAISSVTVYFRDLQHISGILGMAWMYLTPIMYSSDMIPEQYRFIFELNPMTHIIQGYRTILYYGDHISFTSMSICFISAFVSLIIGFIVFQLCKKRFAEVM